MVVFEGILISLKIGRGGDNYPFKKSVILDNFVFTLKDLVKLEEILFFTLKKSVILKGIFIFSLK